MKIRWKNLKNERCVREISFSNNLLGIFYINEKKLLSNRILH